MGKLNSVRPWMTAAFAAVLTTSPVLAQDENPFKDVPPNHWAYQAVTQLQKDGLIQGYPDGYFKGQRPLTRYEMAVVVARVQAKIESMLANANTANQVKPEDIEALRKLVDEYGTELKDVQKDVADLKKQVAVDSATLKRAQFHLYYFLRAGNWQDQASVVNLPTIGGVGGGTNSPPDLKVVGPNNGANGGQTILSGLHSHGYAYQVVRLVFAGQVSDTVGYKVRLEDRYYMDSLPNSSGGNSGGGSTPAGAAGFPNNTTFRLNYAEVDYNDHSSGFKATVGRFVDCDGDIGLNWCDYFNGGRIGYNKGPIDFYAFYGFDNPANAASAPIPGQSQHTLAARLAWAPNMGAGKSAHVGVGYIDDVNSGAISSNLVNNGVNWAASGPITAMSTISVDGSWAIPNFAVQVEGLERVGNDPTTGTTWKDNGSYWAKVFLGPRTPKTGNAYVEGGIVAAGQNSTGLHTEINGTTDYTQIFFNGSPNGYQIGYGGVHYYFGPGAEIGLFYEGWRLAPNDNLNIAPTAAGFCSTTGCAVTNDSGRAIFFQTLLSF